jgi:Nucleoside 2-deoxyribosyltransferase like
MTFCVLLPTFNFTLQSEILWYHTYMNVIYSDQKVEFTAKNIFLAGPTPRSPQVKSWRPDALSILHKMGFKGTVFVPEYRNWETKFDYLTQVEWEWEGLEKSNAIAFWIPRDLITMPAFTTNVEFGSYVRSGRAYYGRPDGCSGNSYLDWLYGKVTNRKPTNTMENLFTEILGSI